MRIHPVVQLLLKDIVIDVLYHPLLLNRPVGMSLYADNDKRAALSWRVCKRDNVFNECCSVLFLLIRIGCRKIVRIPLEIQNVRLGLLEQ